MAAARAWGIKNCDKCPNKLQKPHACQKEAEWVEGLITEECPVLWLGEFWQVVRTHLYLEKGILPSDGGWSSQPAVLMQLTEIFTQEYKRG